MVVSGSQWLPVVYTVVFSGSMWFPVCSLQVLLNCYNAVVLNGSQWLTVVLNGSQRLPVVLNNLQWF